MIRPYGYLILGFFLWLRVWLCNVIHNTLVHPLMPFLPEFIWKPAHDWTAKLWGDSEYAYRRHLILFDDYGDF